MRDRIRKLFALRPFRITLLVLCAVALIAISLIAILNGIVVGSTKDRILTVEETATLEEIDCVIVLGTGLKRRSEEHTSELQSR